MNKYTEELIAKIRSVDFFRLRDCSICCSPIGWRHRDEHIFIDTNCDCVSYWSEPQYVEPDSLDFYTNQEGWRKEFGLNGSVEGAGEGGCE